MHVWIDAEVAGQPVTSARTACRDGGSKDLRSARNPFERGEESSRYNDCFLEQLFLQYSAPPILGKWLESFREFPPRASSQLKTGRRNADR